MVQQRKLSKANTTVMCTDGMISVTLYNTLVVEMIRNIITLDTGGHFTTTTKTRMNQASNQFGLGYYVFQEKGQWYVNTGTKNIPFNGNTVSFTKGE